MRLYISLQVPVAFYHNDIGSDYKVEGLLVMVRQHEMSSTSSPIYDVDIVYLQFNG